MAAPRRGGPEVARRGSRVAGSRSRSRWGGQKEVVLPQSLRGSHGSLSFTANGQDQGQGHRTGTGPQVRPLGSRTALPTWASRGRLPTRPSLRGAEAGGLRGWMFLARVSTTLCVPAKPSRLLAGEAQGQRRPRHSTDSGAEGGWMAGPTILGARGVRADRACGGQRRGCCPGEPGTVRMCEVAGLRSGSP